ncbi:MAG TPA: DUF3089 domain-containing protein [Sphingomicrobium sp.]|nr:DUF3089 domain-containing protein [Sphingomicrobium sp.]
MCVRRFLILMVLLVLIAVAGAFALFQWGDRMLIRQATPKGHFQAPPRASGPDYSKQGSWLAKPGMADDPSTWLPPNIAFQSPSQPAAIFYVHPTTYLDRDRWNAPLSGHTEADRRAALFVQSQGSALTSAGQVWAPRYRQAAYGAFLLRNDDATKALDLAYGDVRAAFDAFLAAQPRDLPLILAGHSQGSMHLLRLLAERKDALKDRLVAAYVVGWPASATADLPATALTGCTSAEQAGCLLSWQSFREPANTNLVTNAWVGTDGLTGARRKRDDMLCVNPLTGTSEGAAPASANPGTLVPNGNLSSATIEAGKVGARCDEGFLKIEGEIPALGPYVLPGNNYHVYDYALFWGAIRADAERRLRAWRAR